MIKFDEANQRQRQALMEELETIGVFRRGSINVFFRKCGKPGCRCATDPSARHGPYSEWGHMRGGKLVHRSVTAEQAALLEQAIANYRKARKLMQSWEAETEKLIVAEAPRIEP